MKTFRALLALLLFVAALLPARAHESGGIEEGPALAYSAHGVKGENKLVLAYQNRTDAKVTIRLYNERHELLLAETRHDRQGAQAYDLSSFGPGTYWVSLQAGDFQAEQAVAVNVAELPQRPFEALVSTDLRQPRHLRLAYGNATEPVEVTISDAYGNVVYRHSSTQYAHHNRLLNMEHLKPGQYTVAITSGAHTATGTYMAVRQ